MADYTRGRPLRSSALDPRLGPSSASMAYQSLDRARVMTPFEYRHAHQQQYHPQQQPPLSSTAYYHHPPASFPSEDAYERRPYGNGTAGVTDASERYTRLLERDIESLRSELRAAREKAEDPQLLRELRDAQDALRREQQTVADLERQVAAAETTSAHLSRLQEECDKLRQDYRQQQLDATHMQRDLSHAQDAVLAAESREESLRTELARAREDLAARDQRASELQHELLQLKRQAERDKDTAGLQHNRELSALQLELSALQQKVASREHELKSREHTIETLQAQLKKEIDRSREMQNEHEKTATQLRQAREQLENSLRVAVQDNEAKGAAVANKESVIQMLEEQKKDMQTHIEDQSATIQTLRADISALTASQVDKDGEIAQLQSQLSSLEAQVQTSDQLRQAEEERLERQRNLYSELAEILRASEAQRQSGLVSSKAREVVAARDQLEAELQGLKKELAMVTRESAAKDTTIAQMERGAERAAADRERLDGEIAALREELLARTRELKDSTIAQESLTRETRLQEERISRYDELLAEKDRQIETLNHRLDDAKTDGDHKVDDMRTTITRAEELHQREVTRLKDEITHLKDMSRADRTYADVCHRISLFLHLDTDVTASTHAENLYHAIEALKRRAEAAEANANVWTMQPSRPATAQHAYDRFEYDRMDRMDRMRDDRDTRKRMAELEEDVVNARIEFESFRREIARAVHCTHPHDTEAILDAVAALEQKHGRVNESTRRLGSSRKNKDIATRNEVQDQEVKKLKRKLAAALKTIESQEMWISTMEKKLKDHKGNAFAQHDEEIRQLQSEVAHWKQQVMIMEQSRPGTAQLNNSYGGLSQTDLMAFRSTISELEGRLQKHIDFRAKVIRALGMTVISATDQEILQTIDGILTGRDRGRRDYLAYTSPAY
eukprot:m.138729 g.138729  ORF g.138729 m.138729 type:complete len:910 (+) comp15922_c0_seq2:343-3072(+)